MTIHVEARGVVTDAPADVTVDGGQATVLVIRDPNSMNEQVSCEVWCRDTLLRQVVRDGVRTGDAVVVIGLLALRRPPWPFEDDLCGAMVSIEAVAVAQDVYSPKVKAGHRPGSARGDGRATRGRPIRSDP